MIRSVLVAAAAVGILIVGAIAASAGNAHSRSASLSSITRAAQPATTQAQTEVQTQAQATDEDGAETDEATDSDTDQDDAAEQAAEAPAAASAAVPSGEQENKSGSEQETTSGGDD
jgi:hypothetical protein